MKKRILVVDDSGPSRVIPGLILRPFGFLVFETMSGEEALAVLENMSVDLILLDMKLPDVHGTELLDKIRQMPSHHKTKIVAHTAVDSEGDIDLYATYGFDAFLSKPYRSSELIDCIRALLAVV